MGLQAITGGQLPQIDPARNAFLVRWLAEKVMGWHDAGAGSIGSWIAEDGSVHSLALDSWADAGMVWERAAELGIFTLSIGPEGCEVPALSYREAPVRWQKRTDGPRAICEAIARATGFVWPQLADGRGDV